VASNGAFSIRLAASVLALAVKEAVRHSMQACNQFCLDSSDAPLICSLARYAAAA